MSDAPSAPTAGNDTYATEHSFASLGIATPMVDALAAQGIVTAFPIQAMTIADALAGRDTCGKAKTGSGKTLGFGLPLLQRVAEINARDGRHEGPVARPRGLVLLPTRELAVQVFEVIETLGAAMGLSVVSVYGGADIEKQIKQMRAGVDVIIATPGRLIDLGDRGEVKVDGLDILVLDEADRMADMGFMPQVEWVLRRLADRPHQTLLFSATLDGAVDRLVKRYMNDPIFHEVASDSQTVSLMVHHFFAVHKMDRNKVLATICKAQNKTIIFCRTKRGADRVVEDMEKEGVKAAAIHGDLRQAQRERALADFSTDACTLTRRKTTKPICTVRAAPLVRVRRVWSCRCCCGIRWWKQKSSCAALKSSDPSLKCSPTTPISLTWRIGSPLWRNQFCEQVGEEVEGRGLCPS